MLRFSQISAKADDMQRVMVMDLNFKITDMQHKFNCYLLPTALMPSTQSMFSGQQSPHNRVNVWDILSCQKDFLPLQPHNKVPPHMVCAASQMAGKAGDLGMFTYGIVQLEDSGKPYPPFWCRSLRWSKCPAVKRCQMNEIYPEIVKSTQYCFAVLVDMPL